MDKNKAMNAILDDLSTTNNHEAFRSSDIPVSTSTSSDSFPIFSPLINQNSFVERKRKTDCQNSPCSNDNGTPVGAKIPRNGSMFSSKTIPSAQESRSQTWRQKITADLRERIAKMWVQKLSSSAEVTPATANILKNLEDYAGKMVTDAYELANSKGEFYLLVAEKYNKMNVELDKKRTARRLLQTQARQHTQLPQSRPQTWRRQTDAELREHLAKKWVQSILPIRVSSTTTVPVRPNILENFQEYARKAVTDAYESADSRSKFYFLVAEKYNKMNIELDKRRILRARRQNDCAVTTSSQRAKKWQEKFDPKIRNDYVEKITQVVAVIPNLKETSDGTDVDKKVKAYCENMEKEIYETADSEAEYYHLFSMKFYEFLTKKSQHEQFFKESLYSVD